MHVEDPYQELGLSPQSSDAEVKAAWRRLSAQWHPDRNKSPQALRKIQRINRALEEIRRARAAAGEAPDQEADDTPAAETEDPGHDTAAPLGEPVAEHIVELTIEEIANGCVRDLRGEVIEDCANCDGTGRELQDAGCAECGGTGSVRQDLWFGWVSSTVTCKACEGRGTTRQDCAACEASGKLATRYRCRAQIPPGVRDNDVLHVSARAQSGMDRQRAIPLSLRVALQPHDLFDVEVDGTLTCEVPVDGFAWTANRWTEIPTPRGLQQMKLRRGYLTYRIKEAGLPWGTGESSADCIVTVQPLFPDELNPEQEAAIDHLLRSNSGDARTPAGKRMAQWRRRIDDWSARRG